MKRACMWAVLAAGMGLGAGAAVGADVTFENYVLSKYVWRGHVYSDDWVYEPAFDIAAKNGFGAYFWGNVDLTDVNSTAEEDVQWKPTEMDLTLYYGLPIEGPVSVELGLAQYTYPHPSESSGSTREVYVKAEADTLLAPSLTVYYDFDEADGFYLTAGLSHTQELNEKLSLIGGVSVGYGDASYNDFYFSFAGAGPDCPCAVDANDAAFNDFNATLELAWKATEQLTLSALGQYMTVLDDTLRDGANKIHGTDEAWVGGVKAAWAF